MVFRPMLKHAVHIEVFWHMDIRTSRLHALLYMRPAPARLRISPSCHKPPRLDIKIGGGLGEANSTEPGQGAIGKIVRLNSLPIARHYDHSLLFVRPAPRPRPPHAE